MKTREPRHPLPRVHPYTPSTLPLTKEIALSEGLVQVHEGAVSLQRGRYTPCVANYIVGVTRLRQDVAGYSEPGGFPL